MKRLVFAAVLATATAVALAGDYHGPARIGQPGYYGPLDLGGYPRPRVIYPRPIVIERVPINRAPVYLLVPPEHARHWREYCREYHACGEPVFFVQDNWYKREYIPRYQDYHRDHHDEYRGNQNDYHRD